MRFQRSNGACFALLGATWFIPSAGIAVAPYSGVPFTQDMPLTNNPSATEDAKNPEMLVSRLLKADTNSRTVSPHVCDMGDQADKDKCLGVAGRGCMWTRVETRDPLKRVQASNAYCLPCRLDGKAMPCWNPGAWVNGKQVTDCKMSCMHQQRIWQPQYACSDTTGFISQAQCFSRGAQSGSKCMFVAYKDKNDKLRGGCGPCELAGTGGWGCPANNEEGPEAGSKVVGCMSQCDVLCAGPPACPPTVAPPPPPPPPSPGIVQTSSDPDKMESAPAPFNFQAPDPNAAVEAMYDAARKAGWQVGTTGPPKVFWPVIYYRSPGDYMFTTGPPPNLGPEAPAALLQTEEDAVTKTHQPLLHRHRSAP